MSRKMTVKAKKEWAELLFSRTLMTASEIAERVGVSNNTMSKWRAEGNWDQLRTSFFVTKGQELSRIYQQLANLNKAIASRDENERFASPREADTISKLASAAKNLETQLTISDIVDVFLEFTNWLRENDFNKAKDVSDLMDAYIKNKMSSKV